MEIVYFTIVAVGIYFLSDAILRTIERFRGGLLPNRSVVFLIIITVLAVGSFQIIERLAAPVP